jgi:hypothetical protein
MTPYLPAGSRSADIQLAWGRENGEPAGVAFAHLFQHFKASLALIGSVRDRLGMPSRAILNPAGFRHDQRLPLGHKHP